MNLYRRDIFLVVCLMLCFFQQATSQDSGSTYDKVFHFPDRLFSKVTDKSNDIDLKLTARTEKYLERLAKEERKLKKKLAKKDSLAASKLFNDAEAQYAAFQSKIKGISDKSTALRNKYMPHLDTLKTAFSFLEKSDGLLKNTEQSRAQLKSALSKMDGLQDKFNQAEEIKKFIQQRRHLLKEQLAKYGLSKELKKLQKQVYYYQAQVEEYKRMFEDPSKLESKALELLHKTPLFKDFSVSIPNLPGCLGFPELHQEFHLLV